MQYNMSTASHMAYNNRFKEAVLAEAMRDHREQLSLRTKFVKTRYYFNNLGGVGEEEKAIQAAQGYRVQ
jgi:hypothetical protein